MRPDTSTRSLPVSSTTGTSIERAIPCSVSATVKVVPPVTRVAPDEGRADLYLRLDRLVIDEPGLRAEAGFDTEPSAADVAATRRNMLESVLEAERHPFAVVSATGAGRATGGTTLTVAVTLHGIARSFEVPVVLETGSERVEVSGRMTLDQTAFGITPFSVLGGAIAVLDRVDIRFRIRADRVHS